MKNCYVIDYKENERQEFCLFLKLLGFKWANGKSILQNEKHCFPFCIDVERKVVYLTNVYFLKEFKEQGGQFVSVDTFKNIIEHWNKKIICSMIFF